MLDKYIGKLYKVRHNIDRCRMPEYIYVYGERDNKDYGYNLIIIKGEGSHYGNMQDDKSWIVKDSLKKYYKVVEDE